MNNVTPEWLTLGWEIVVTLASLFAFCVSLWAYLNFASRKDVERRFDDHAKKIAIIEVQIATVENDISHAPNRDDFHQLTQQLGNLNQALSTLQGAFQSQSRLLAVIHDHLLNGPT